MHNRSCLHLLALSLGATMVTACAIDSAGLETAKGTGSGGAAGTAGSIGTPGTGGANTGGRGGVMGTGGVTGTGGTTNTCNPSTCPNGCCMGTACLTNRNDQHCGTASVACASCAACYQCSDVGVCELDPSANWDIICSSATIVPTKPLNVPWDVATPGISPLPDPYCQFTLDGASLARTTTLLNTLTPMWNQSITPTSMDITEDILVSQAGRWQVGVVDEDLGVMPADPVCAAVPRLTPANFAAGMVALPATPNCTSLTIQLVCVP